MDGAPKPEDTKMPSIIYNVTENVQSDFGRNFDRWLARATDAQLQLAIRGLEQQQENEDLEEEVFDHLQDQIEAILKELEGREHDRRDPSSGLGCHQPS